MGWASGSELADRIWATVGKHIHPADRKKVAKKIIQLFEDQDCDTMDECEELQKAAEGDDPQ